MDQSSTPWRVFDAQAEGTAAAAGGRAAEASNGREGPRVPQLALAGVGAAVLVGGLALVVALGGTDSAVAIGPGMSDGADATSFGVQHDGAEIVVDVAGAVVAPGVYHLAPGSRVGEAIDAAGGFGARVDAGRVAIELNLAATLADGQQVRVPSRDDPEGGVAGAGGTGSGAGGGTAPATGGAGPLIDLNTATQAELESLPGIGPVTAGKIIEARGATAFRTVDELRQRGLVGEKTFDAIKALVTVR